MVEKKKSKLIEAIKAIEGSEEAKELRGRLTGIAKNIQEAPKGSVMAEIMDDLTRTKRILDKSPNLKMLYGLHVKVLMEEVEFKKTGKRVVID